MYAGYLDLDQELPGGGWLVAGQTCRVGFKAVNPSGLSEDVSGTIYSSKEKEDFSLMGVCRKPYSAQ